MSHHQLQTLLIITRITSIIGITTISNYDWGMDVIIRQQQLQQQQQEEK